MQYSLLSWRNNNFRHDIVVGIGLSDIQNTQVTSQFTELTLLQSGKNKVGLCLKCIKLSSHSDTQFDENRFSLKFGQGSYWYTSNNERFCLSK